MGEPTTTQAEVWPTFQDFWDAYSNKISRPKCEKKWTKLAQADKVAIMQHIPHYKQYLKVKNISQKYPETFLNNRSWEDELIIPDNGRTKQQPTVDEFASIANHFFGDNG